VKNKSKSCLHERTYTALTNDHNHALNVLTDLVVKL